MIFHEKVSATLAGTAWVSIKTFTGPAYIHELWFDVPDNIGTGTNVEIALFAGDFLTDGQERYNSGSKAENSDYDLTLERAVVSGDKLMIKADGAATKSVDCVLYYEEN